jgi:hypothetical protein
MKRKVYTTGRERIIDRIIGFLAFPLLNAPLGIILWIIPQTNILSPTSNATLLLLLAALPWIVNGLVLVLAFLLRPEFGYGYIAFIFDAVAVATVVGIAFVAACFVIIPFVPVLGDQTGWALVLLLGFLLVFGLLAFGVVAYQIIKSL